jgi:hypothetical protein
VLSAAFAHLDAAEAKGMVALAKESREWWHGFWSRAFVHMSSADGEADFVAANYNYFLYLMASSSRGKLPPKFNGMLWNTGGDLRTWGAQHWFANLSCYYELLLRSAAGGQSIRADGADVRYVLGDVRRVLYGGSPAVG